MLVFALIVLGGVAAISAVWGALAHKSVPHAVAIGYYVAGAAFLVAGFALGSRGPTRTDPSDDPEAYRPSPMGVLGFSRARYGSRRKATPEERREGRLASV